MPVTTIRRLHDLLSRHLDDCTLHALDGREITHNTRLHASPGRISIVFHATTIAVVDLDAQYRPVSVRLNSGGWRTATTKQRLNEILRAFAPDYGVFQKDHEWRVWYRPTDEDWEFADGDTWPVAVRWWRSSP